MLSELISHKRIDVAIEAFAELGLPLVIAGDGPDRRRLRRNAPPNVHFAGRVDDAEAAHLLATCRAFVLTGVEEFGIAAVEAQASGRPVIARRGGGALETVIDGVTGCFWEGGPAELAAAVRGFDDAAIDPTACTDNARRFAPETFRAALAHQVEAALVDARSGTADQGVRGQHALPRRRMPGTRRGRGVAQR